MSLLTAVVVTLAAVRLSILVVFDTITQPIRARIIRGTSPVARFAAKVVTCLWCASVWVGVAVAFVVTYLPGRFVFAVLAGLALSLLTIAVNSVLDVLDGLADSLAPDDNTAPPVAAPPAVLKDLENR